MNESPKLRELGRGCGRMFLLDCSALKPQVSRGAMGGISGVPELVDIFQGCLLQGGHHGDGDMPMNELAGLINEVRNVQNVFERKSHEDLESHCRARADEVVWGM